MASRTRARLNNLNDRAREVGLSDVLTLDDIDALKAYYDFTCLKCGANPAISPDHVKPLSSGGENTIENLQLLCDNCNKAKQDTEIDYRNGKVLHRQFADDWIRENKQHIKFAHETGRETDWERIKIRYVTEEITLHELADEENVTHSSIEKRAERGKWTQERENHRRKVSSEVVNALVQKEINARLIAAGTAKAVIESWLNSVKEEASASDALNASKLLLVMAGEATDRLDIHKKLIEEIVKSDELGQVGTTQERQPTSNWLRTLAAANSDTLVA